MTIAAIAYSTPEARLTNEDVLGELSRRNGDPSAPEARRVLDDIAGVLKRCGSSVRHLDLSPRQGYVLALVADACRRALAQAAIAASEVDLLIYCGVARGWLEPSTASVIQSVVGADRASCFDVLEACAGWMRAVQLAKALIEGGSYRNALIVGAEAGMQGYGPHSQALSDFRPEQYAAFTVGEAASATVLKRGDLDGIAIEIRSLGDHFDLCMIPLPNAAFFTPPNRPPPDGERFYSVADRLFSIAIAAGVGVWREKIDEIGLANIDLVVAHGASTRATTIVCQALGLPSEKCLCSHAAFGNTEVNTIPIAIAAAADEGRLRPGGLVLCLVAGSGISIGWGTLVY